MKTLEILLLVKGMITQINYSYFTENEKMIALDLSKQQEWDADPRAFRQINFTGKIDRAGNTTMLLNIEEAKETVLELVYNRK